MRKELMERRTAYNRVKWQQSPTRVHGRAATIKNVASFLATIAGNLPAGSRLQGDHIKIEDHVEQIKSELQSLIVQRLRASKDARMIRDGIARQYNMLPEDFLQKKNKPLYDAANHHLMLDLFSERFACMALGLTDISVTEYEDVLMCYTCNKEIVFMRGGGDHYVHYSLYGLPHPSDIEDVRSW